MKFGGNQSGKIIGTGTIGNSSTSINNVWLVDGLEHNLLSISQFCDNGYDVLFEKPNCTVINKEDKSIVFKGKRVDNVYKINFSELADQKVICLLSVNDNPFFPTPPVCKTREHASGMVIKKRSIFLSVTVTGPPVLICSIKSGRIEPREPSTFPNRTSIKAFSFVSDLVVFFLRAF